MRARLSFAVAACQEPEILIVDEALATGDVRFVQKCINRIHEITRSGTTALFVSHNIWSIRRLTSRCILVDSGKIVDDGDTSRVTDRYYEVMLKNEVFDKPPLEPEGSQFVGSGEVQLRRVDLRDAYGRSTRVLNTAEFGALWLELDTHTVPRKAGLRVIIHRDDGLVATIVAGLSGGTLNEKYEFVDQIFDLEAGRSAVRFDFANVLLAPGDYSVDLHIFDPASHSGFTSSQQYFFKTRILEFGIRRLGNPNRGMVFYQPASAILTSWTTPVAN
jgi:hypothetical protein